MPTSYLLQKPISGSTPCPILTSPQFHVFLKGKLTQQLRIKGDEEMASLAPEQKPPLPQGAQGTEACRSGQGGCLEFPTKAQPETALTAGASGAAAAATATPERHPAR